MMKHKILIVDDEVANLQIIVEILEEASSEYEIFQTLNGQRALEIVPKVTPDIIITDWEMPVMNGIELIRELKAKPETADIPVIMCTGVMITPDNLRTALEAGAVDYIRKPIDAVELIARLRSMLELADSAKKIRRLNETKDKIFAIISHELRSPVGNLLSMLKILRDFRIFGDEQKAKTFLDLAIKNAGTTFSLLENLLFWAKSQRNDITYSPQVFSLEKLVQEVANMLSEVIADKNIEIELKLTSTSEVYADRIMLHTVVRNLLNNATKFTPKNGKIAISVEKQKQTATLSVQDTGVGIPPENMAKLFDPKEHVSTFGTSNEKGSGLGLKLCKEFVDINQGKINVESKEGKGSRFYVTLPLAS